MSDANPQKPHQCTSSKSGGLVRSRGSNIRQMRTTGKLKLNENGIQSGRWTKEEHAAFLGAMQQHGRNWSKIADSVRTRTSAQVMQLINA